MTRPGLESEKPYTDEDHRRDIRRRNERGLQAVDAALDFLRVDAQPPAESELLLESMRCESAGDFAAAAAALERVCAQYPASLAAQQAMYRLALIAGQESNDPQAAAAHYRRLLDAFPGGCLAWRAHLRLGEILEDAGDFEKAIAHYRAAAGSWGDARWLEAQLREAICRVRQGRLEDAAVVFRQVVDNQDTGIARVRALFGGAYCYEELGRPHDAARLYRYLKTRAGSTYNSARYLRLSPTRPHPFDLYLRQPMRRDRSIDIAKAAETRLAAIENRSPQKKRWAFPYLD